MKALASAFMCQSQNSVPHPQFSLNWPMQNQFAPFPCTGASALPVVLRLEGRLGAPEEGSGGDKEQGRGSGLVQAMQAHAALCIYQDEQLL